MAQEILTQNPAFKCELYNKIQLMFLTGSLYFIIKVVKEFTWFKLLQKVTSAIQSGTWPEETTAGTEMCPFVRDQIFMRL